MFPFQNLDNRIARQHPGLWRLGCKIYSWNNKSSGRPLRTVPSDLENRIRWYHWRAKTVWKIRLHHYDDVIMGAMASQVTIRTIVYSTVYSDADQSKHQSSTSLAFVWGIHRGPVNSPHKWPVTRKMLPFDDVIMIQQCVCYVPSIVWCHRWPHLIVMASQITGISFVFSRACSG